MQIQLTYLRSGVIVPQNIDDRVGRGKIRCHRDVRTGPGNRLDGTGVGQVGIDGVVVDRQPGSCTGPHRKGLQVAFAGRVDRTMLMWAARGSPSGDEQPAGLPPWALIWLSRAMAPCRVWVPR